MKSKDEILAISETHKNLSCIYFLISDNEIVYIGQTIDLWNRISEHKQRKKIIFNRYSLADEPAATRWLAQSQ